MTYFHHTSICMTYFHHTAFFPVDSAPSITKQEVGQPDAFAASTPGWYKAVTSLYTSWAVYCRQDILLANIALGLLYMTVRSIAKLRHKEKVKWLMEALRENLL
jgi:hypothetical protein